MPNDFNEYEKAVALFLDSRPQVLWWYRNLVGPPTSLSRDTDETESIPISVVQEDQESKAAPRVLVVESKGKHLEANPDTKYKQSVAEYFEKLGKSVSWQELAKTSRTISFVFKSWMKVNMPTGTGETNRTAASRFVSGPEIPFKRCGGNATSVCLGSP